MTSVHFWGVITLICVLTAIFAFENSQIHKELEKIKGDLEGHVVASLYYKQTFDMLREQFEQAARSQIARQVEDAK